MTMPGAVAEQPTMPAKANIERLRESSAQRDAVALSDELEKGFSELLSKLNAGDGQQQDDTALPSGSSRQAEPRQVRQRDIAAWMAQDAGAGDASLPAAADCVPCGDPQLVRDPHPEGTTDAPRSDVPPPPELNTTIVNTLAAIATLPSVQPAAASDPEVPVRSSSASRAAAPAGATHGLVDDGVGPAEAQLPLQLERTAKGQWAQSTEDRTPTTATNLVLARAGAPVAGVAKGQLRQDAESQQPADAADLILASASAPEAVKPGGYVLPAEADVPKASVLRMEAHFAPVSPSAAGPHADVSAADGGKPGIEANAKVSEATVARSVDAALPSAEGPVPLAVSPAQQIADRIATEAAAFEIADRVGAAPDQAGAKPVLKILQIQLQPADLGTITVRMELKETGLKLHVEADRTETADIIRGDQDTLSKLLRSAGYGIDPGSIRIVEGDRSVTPPQAGQQGAQTNLQSSTQSQSGWSERQDRAQRGNTGPRGGDAQISTNRNDIHETTANRTGRDLYV